MPQSLAIKLWTFLSENLLPTLPVDSDEYRAIQKLHTDLGTLLSVIRDDQFYAKIVLEKLTSFDFERFELKKFRPERNKTCKKLGILLIPGLIPSAIYAIYLAYKSKKKTGSRLFFLSPLRRIIRTLSALITPTPLPSYLQHIISMQKKGLVSLLSVVLIKDHPNESAELVSIFEKLMELRLFNESNLRKLQVALMRVSNGKSSIEAIQKSLEFIPQFLSSKISTYYENLLSLIGKPQHLDVIHSYLASLSFPKRDANLDILITLLSNENVKPKHLPSLLSILLILREKRLDTLTNCMNLLDHLATFNHLNLIIQTLHNLNLLSQDKLTTILFETNLAAVSSAIEYFQNEDTVKLLKFHIYQFFTYQEHALSLAKAFSVLKLKSWEINLPGVPRNILIQNIEYANEIAIGLLKLKEHDLVRPDLLQVLIACCRKGYPDVVDFLAKLNNLSLLTSENLAHLIDHPILAKHTLLTLNQLDKLGLLDDSIRHSFYLHHQHASQFISNERPSLAYSETELAKIRIFLRPKNLTRLLNLTPCILKNENENVCDNLLLLSENLTTEEEIQHLIDEHIKSVLLKQGILKGGFFHRENRKSKHEERSVRFSPYNEEQDAPETAYETAENI